MDTPEINEVKAISAVIDSRLENIGITGTAQMLRMFELISASYVGEDGRPTVLVHGVGNNVVILSINADEFQTVNLLAAAYTKAHDTFIGDKPEPGDMH
jgi:hypothetical protein